MIKPESSIFPYLKTKAHALLSYSPTEQHIKSMVTARNLDELRSILTPTFAGSSAKLLVEGKNPILQFESQLRHEFSEMLKKMVNISSGSMYSTLNAFEFKLTGYNLKTIFKTIILGLDREEMYASLVPTSHHSKDQLKEIIEFERPDILLDYIPSIELKNALTLEVNETVSDREKIFKINNIIDKHIYLNLQKEDRDIQNEIDFINILITCRAIQLNFSPTKYLIPEHPYFLRILERANNFKSIPEVLNYISSNSPHFSPFIKKALAEDPNNPLRYLDISYRRILIKRDQSFFRTNFTDNRAIIKFLNMRWTEINDIVRIAFGKKNDIDFNIISQSLLVYNQYI